MCAIRCTKYVVSLDKADFPKGRNENSSLQTCQTSLPSSESFNSSPVHTQQIPTLPTTSHSRRSKPGPRHFSQRTLAFLPRRSSLPPVPTPPPAARLAGPWAGRCPTFYPPLHPGFCLCPYLRPVLTHLSHKLRLTYLNGTFWIPSGEFRPPLTCSAPAPVPFPGSRLLCLESQVSECTARLGTTCAPRGLSSTPEFTAHAR